eukprot:365800-Chlamydomonas_euryale.AAC.4
MGVLVASWVATHRLGCGGRHLENRAAEQAFAGCCAGNLATPAAVRSLLRGAIHAFPSNRIPPSAEAASCILRLSRIQTLAKTTPSPAPQRHPPPSAPRAHAPAPACPAHSRTPGSAPSVAARCSRATTTALAAQLGCRRWRPRPGSSLEGVAVRHYAAFPLEGVAVRHCAGFPLEGVPAIRCARPSLEGVPAIRSAWLAAPGVPSARMGLPRPLPGPPHGVPLGTKHTTPTRPAGPPRCRCPRLRRRRPGRRRCFRRLLRTCRRCCCHRHTAWLCRRAGSRCGTHVGKASNVAAGGAGRQGPRSCSSGATCTGPAAAAMRRRPRPRARAHPRRRRLRSTIRQRHARAPGSPRAPARRTTPRHTFAARRARRRRRRRTRRTRRARLRTPGSASPWRRHAGGAPAAGTRHGMPSGTRSCMGRAARRRRRRGTRRRTAANPNAASARMRRRAGAAAGALAAARAAAATRACAAAATARRWLQLRLRRQRPRAPSRPKPPPTCAPRRHARRTA